MRKSLNERTSGRHPQASFHKILAISYWSKIGDVCELAHLAIVLPGMLQSDAVQSEYDAIRARVDEAADRLELSVPTGTLSHARPGEPIISDFRSLAETYRRTSPELIVAGGIIRQALPLD